MTKNIWTQLYWALKLSALFTYCNPSNVFLIIFESSPTQNRLLSKRKKRNSSHPTQSLKKKNTFKKMSIEAGKSRQSTPLGSKGLQCNFTRKTQRIYSSFYSDQKKTLALKETLPKCAVLQWKLQQNAFTISQHSLSQGYY